MRILLCVFIVLICLPSFTSADSTFFDNPNDAFVMGNPPSTPPTTDSEITSWATGGGGCLTNWTCIPLGSCVNGIQTRNCTKEKSYCYADLKKKPAQIQNCAEEKPLGNISKPSIPADELDKPEEKPVEIPDYVYVIATVTIVFILGWFYYHNLNLNTHRK